MIVKKRRRPFKLEAIQVNESDYYETKGYMKIIITFLLTK